MILLAGFKAEMVEFSIFLGQGSANWVTCLLLEIKLN